MITFFVWMLNFLLKFSVWNVLLTKDFSFPSNPVDLTWSTYSCRRYFYYGNRKIFVEGLSHFLIHFSFCLFFWASEHDNLGFNYYCIRQKISPHNNFLCHGFVEIPFLCLISVTRLSQWQVMLNFYKTLFFASAPAPSNIILTLYTNFQYSYFIGRECVTWEWQNWTVSSLVARPLDNA